MSRVNSLRRLMTARSKPVEPRVFPFSNRGAAVASLAQPDRTGATSLNAVQRVGFGIVAVYVFLLFSRVQDYVSFLHLPAVMVTLALMAMVASGALLRVINSHHAKLLLAMTVWMALSIPFSVWPGGAFDVFFSKWLNILVIFFILATLVSTVRQVYVIMCIVSLGVVVGAIQCLMMGDSLNGRMVLGEIGRFSDPNDLAQFMLLGICVTLGVLSKKHGSVIGKVILYPGLAAMLVTFLRTGSRGGFIGMLAVVLLLFFQSSGRQRLLAVAGVVVLIVPMLLLLPEAIRARYAYVFGIEQSTTNQDPNSDEAGESSAEARQHLFWQSVTITLHNPIFGVGPGMFAVSENDLAKMKGLPRGLWHETHNMYTQVSSEEGIPAMILFISVLVLAVKMLSRIHRLGKDSADPDIIEAGRIAYWLRLAIFAFMVTGTFLSVAYTEIFFVVIGLSLALHNAIQGATVPRADVQPMASRIAMKFGM